MELPRDARVAYYGTGVIGYLRDQAIFVMRREPTCVIYSRPEVGA